MDDKATIKERIDSVDLSDKKHQFFTIPAYLLTIMMGTGLTFNDQLANMFGFATVARAEAVEAKVDTLAFTLNLDIASRMVERYETTLAHHVEENIDSPSWRSTKRDMEQRVQLAHSFRDCIMEDKPRCSEIQKQLAR